MQINERRKSLSTLSAGALALVLKPIDIAPQPGDRAPAQRPPQQPLGAVHRSQEPSQLNAGMKPGAVCKQRQILGGEIAGRPQCERAATDPADACIEAPHTARQRGIGVRRDRARVRHARVDRGQEQPNRLKVGGVNWPDAITSDAVTCTRPVLTRTRGDG